MAAECMPRAPEISRRLIHPMQMSRTRIRIVPTRTVRTRTAQIVRTVLHLHRRIVERTKIPTIKILLIRMDMIRQTDINLIEKAKRGIRREVTEET